MKAWEILVTATVTMVVVYLFVANAQGASQVINAGATGWANLVTAFQGRRQMSFRNFVVISIGLVILYVLLTKSEIYRGVFTKLVEWTARGVTVLTTGKTE